MRIEWKSFRSPLQPFEPIRRRDHQVLQPARRVEPLKLALGRARKALKLTHELIVEQGFGPLVPERPDHESVIPDTGMRSSADNSARVQGRPAAILVDQCAPGGAFIERQGRNGSSVHTSVAFMASLLPRLP